MALMRLSFYTFAGILLVVLSFYLGPFLQPAADVTTVLGRELGGTSHFGRNISDDNVKLTKRVSDAAYSRAVTKGNSLYCLMGMTVAQATVHNGGTSLESALQDDIFELEGWQRFESDSTPYFGNYLDAAFAGLGITKNLYTSNKINSVEGSIHEDLEQFEDDPKDGVPSGAQFMNDFIVDAGVIIADKNKNVNNAMQENFGKNWASIGLVVTHIRQWSDAVFLQWMEACSFGSGSISNVKYIFRSWITNQDTQEIVFQALTTAFGSSPTIGTWTARLSLTQAEHPNEFFAVLGSPNGAGSAYLLLTHKEKLGVKTINKVDIFVPNIPYTITSTTGGGMASAAKIMLLFYVEAPVS
ncbi:hypothetical protein BCIN_06g07600 [Botrytis cinerea B05.10]|uniref:Uncharacterized protein n=1 Tax=Botryotinia fuckeliana (strain B05.10) TaxID=332648 RepID=A0A384JLC1_BOTFB|nr:hypothetical protein BCIN_06g07600 [Botrytis cinerea B05.10]ATZ51353.1 hypothetical protein BCIN_06g07600 [Botrytis cinerea B05.10]